MAIRLVVAICNLGFGGVSRWLFVWVLCFNSVFQWGWRGFGVSRVVLVMCFDGLVGCFGGWWLFNLGVLVVGFGVSGVAEF